MVSFRDKCENYHTIPLENIILLILRERVSPDHYLGLTTELDWAKATGWGSDY